MSTATTTPAAQAAEADVDTKRPPAKIRWVPDPNAENLMAGYKVKFRTMNPFPLFKVDETASQKNFARLGAPIDKLRQDQWERYVRSGVPELVVPYLVTYQAPNGFYVIMDGNHRYDLAATRLGMREAAAYVVYDAGTETLNALTRTFNAIGGRGHTADDMLAHAVDFYRRPANRKMKLKDVAQMFIVSAPTLSKKIWVADTRDRLGPRGDIPVPHHDKLNDTILARLSKLSNDAVLRRAVEGLADLPAVDERTAVRLVSEVERVAKTEAKQLAALEAVLAEFQRKVAAKAPDAPGRRLTDPASQVLSDLRRLTNRVRAVFGGDRPPDFRDVFKTDEQRNEARALLADLDVASLQIQKGLS